MAAKVVHQSAEERFFIWAEAIRYNADVIVAQMDNGEPRYMLRLRPWKQDKRSPVMHIGAGDTLVDAMRAVMAEYLQEDEVPLDYAFRPWAVARDAVTPPTL